MLDTKLIESALALTGKEMYFCEETVIHHEIDFENRIYAETNEEFSIEKFCYYLLSPEFIEKYHELTADTINIDIITTVEYIGVAIHEYQKGTPQPLIELLSKI